MPRTHSPLRSAAKLLISICVLTIAFASGALGQSTRSDRGTYNGPQSVTDLDDINLQNGSLSMDIPLASLPPMAGGKLGYTLTAHYNSKQWNVYRTEHAGEVNGGLDCPNLYTSDDLEPSISQPWSIGAGYYIVYHDASEDFAYYTPNSDRCIGTADYDSLQGHYFRPALLTPDGTEHELRAVSYPAGYGGSRSYLLNYLKQQYGYPYYPEFASPIRFYTVDGTYFNVVVNPTSYTTKWTIYAKDGTQIVETASTQTITDTNGNSIEFGTTGGYAYAKDVQTGRIIKWQGVTYNGNSATQVQYQSNGGSWQSVYVTWGTTTVQGMLYTTTDYDTTAESPCDTDTHIQPQTFTVIRSIEYPNTETGVTAPTYSFAYNSDTTSSETTTNAHWGCNASDSTYTRTVSYGWGELNSVTTPSGAVATYDYGTDGEHDMRGPGGDTVVRNYVAAKHIAHDGVTDTWSYVSGDPTVSITNPDGSTHGELSYALDVAYPWLMNSTGQGGLVYRTYSPGGLMTEKHWTLLGGTGLYAYGSGTDKVSYNPVVDTEYTTLLDTDGTTRLKMSAKHFTYDYNGDMTQETDYDWFDPSTVTFSTSSPYLPTAIPSGATVLRVINNSYYNTASSSSSSTAYQSRTLSGSTLVLGKPEETTVGTSSTVNSDTKFSYDGNSYGTAPSAGNLTTTSAYNDTTSAWINTTATYDSHGNVTATTDGNSNTTAITYGSVGGYSDLYPTQIVQAFGTSVARTMQTGYDFYTGLPTSVTDYDNSVTTTTAYDILLRPTLVKNAYGSALENWVENDYHDHDRLVVTKADLVSEGDGKKVATKFFDQLGRVRLAKTLEDASTQSATNETDGIKVETHYFTASGYTYQLTSNPYRASSASAASGEETMGWTRSKAWATGRESQVETFSGATLPYPFLTSSYNTSSTGVVETDIASNATTVTDQAGKLRRSLTDSLGRVIRVDEPNGSNALGTVSSPNQPTNYYYDVLGKLTRVNQGSQNRYFMYNSLGRMVRVFQPEQEVNTSLNTSGNPDNNSWTMGMTYDSNGNVLTTTDAVGTTITNTYDAMNRPLTRSYSDSTPTVTNTYDDSAISLSKGKLTKVSSSVSETQYTGFDVLGRLTQTKQITGGTTYTTSYAYNLSALTQTTYPSGRTVSMTYDADGDIASITGVPYGGSSKTYANNFSYSSDKKIKQLKLGNNLWETAAFNPRLQVTEFDLGTTQGGYDVWKDNYDYGELGSGSTVDGTKNAGNIAKQTETFSGLANPFVQAYAYDPLDRITEAKETVNGSQTWIQDWGYDRYGNRSSFSRNILGSSNTSTPSIDTSSNRYSSGQGYSFDKNGNVTGDVDPVTGHSRSFTFNGDNKQTQVTDTTSSNTAGTYYYDGEGHRVKKVTPTETTTFVYSNGQLLEERNSSGTLTTSYLYAGKQLLATETSSDTNYTATDNLGSPRVITNSAGTIMARRDFLPFGEELFADGTYRKTADGYTTTGSDAVRQRFTGYQRDMETGLDFAEARYYDNAHGRFTAIDPLLASGKSADPQTFDRYAYVENNPIDLADASGLQAGGTPALTPEQIAANRRIVDRVNQVSGADFSHRGDLGRVNQAIDDATRMVAAPTREGEVNQCRQALITNFGVADPTSALSALHTTGGAYTLNTAGDPVQGTQNVFDGRVSENPIGPAADETTVRNFLNAHPTVNAITDRSSGNIYIDDSFHDRTPVQRAQDIIHEAVVHKAGNNGDSEFAPQAEQDKKVKNETDAEKAERLRTAGSHRINEIIQANCPTIPQSH